MQSNVAFSKSNDEWVTDDTVKDSKEIESLPVGWRIVVRPLPQATKSSGGVIFAQQTLSDKEMTETVGTLVAVGPLAWKGEQYQGQDWAQRGDVVMFGKYAGKKFEYGGVKYVLLNEDEIIARIPDPSKLKR